MLETIVMNAEKLIPPLKIMFGLQHETQTTKSQTEFLQKTRRGQGTVGGTANAMVLSKMKINILGAHHFLSQ